MSWNVFYQLSLGCLLASLVVSFVILVKALVDFSRTGPAIKEEILKSYRFYSAYALFRLFFWCFLINCYLAITGNLVYFSLSVINATTTTVLFSFISALSAILFFSFVQFLRHLLFVPSNIALSSHYSMKNFYKVWRWLSPVKIQLIEYMYKFIFLFTVCAAIYLLNSDERAFESQILLFILVIHLFVFFWCTWSVPVFMKSKNNNPGKRSELPNIVMIGSDTLRSDRLGRIRNGHSITPNIDKLIKKSIYFDNCYVPIARTAPSLVSLFTGVSPWKHQIRDNFVEHDDMKLDVTPFPELLKSRGYATAVISDWCGTDFGKFDLGFAKQDLPEDQWNIRYYIRQGPKDMRLFLSLFTKNQLGRVFLPELFYLGGAPQGQYLLNKTKQWLGKLSNSAKPFLLNTFFSTTHPPFGTEYPYYSMYADPDYWGESKFSMARLTDPMEIIKSQKEPKEAFDLEQIIDLYDGS
ncbi:sulfatase-like hydrolase/transferase, partial [bacterium]|nr:sulfatase-like hydrolase/transferase [bacterium]